MFIKTVNYECIFYYGKDNANIAQDNANILFYKWTGTKSRSLWS